VEPQLPFQTVRPTPEHDALVILDQTLLPEREEERTLETLEEMAEAIRLLRVRGAPLLGVFGAWALAVLAERARTGEIGDSKGLLSHLREAASTLEETRPTAVNLAWALERMLRVAESVVSREGDAAAVSAALLAEARAIHHQDREMCRRMGEHALTLLGDDDAPLTLMTHCNAGALATGGMGSALSPVYLAHDGGRKVRVFADETRPLLQGSRLTAWELTRSGVEVTVVTDGMGAPLLRRGEVDAVVVGSDRIAANGDVANKIGTYGLALLAREHGVPFYVLAPTSTVDLECADGDAIPIEERDPEEVREGFGRRTAPEGAAVWNPAFDVTPARLVSAIVTEEGVVRPPFDEGLGDAVERARRTSEAARRENVAP
jgi:methylthioribose-1-phosphate isomerase